MAEQKLRTLESFDSRRLLDLTPFQARFKKVEGDSYIFEPVDETTKLRELLTLDQEIEDELDVESDGAKISISAIEIVVPKDSANRVDKFQENEEYSLLAESFKLLPSDDAPSIELYASSDKAQDLMTWNRLDELAKASKSCRGEIIGVVKGGFAVEIYVPQQDSEDETKTPLSRGIYAFLPFSLAHLDDTPPPYVTGEDSFVGKKDQFQIIEFDRKRSKVVVSLKESLQKKQEQLKATFAERFVAGTRLKGFVSSVVPFGAFVDVGGIEGLLHTSNMAWQRVQDPTRHYQPGDFVEVVVLEYLPKKNRLSLGVKQLTKDPWRGAAKKYEVGKDYLGTVTSLADFGAFVQLESGVIGLVHVSEFTWLNQVDHPRRYIKVGDPIDVRVIEINEKQRRMSLSVRLLDEKPLNVFESIHKAGEIIKGQVVRIEPYGIFVELAPGVTGLVHVSDISWTKDYKTPPTRSKETEPRSTEAESSKPATSKEGYAVGDSITVRILSIDLERQRISLGIKQLKENPWDLALAKAKVGEKVKATITQIVGYGAFAEITPGVEGLIHISEMAEDRVEDPKRIVRIGQEVEALVLSIDKTKEKISLSLYRDELEEPQQATHLESEGTATLGELLSQKGMQKEDLEDLTQTFTPPTLPRLQETSEAEEAEQDAKIKMTAAEMFDKESEPTQTKAPSDHATKCD